MNNFHYIAVLLLMLYGIEISNEDLEELGLLAWNLIGNKNIKLYHYCARLDCNNSVELPCNALPGQDSIEAVTALWEDWSTVTNYSDYGDQRTSFIESSIEAEKYNKNPFYISGKYLKYELSGDRLYFDKNYGTVNILYKGTLMDDEGLPEITDKEANAIATYIAYIQKFKEGLITNNAQIISAANLLKMLWLQLCDQARVLYLNQNAMNNILQVKGSWDRSSYNKSYKPMR